ncbi:Polynucleotide 5'-hydroxyl-kinase grc3 [Quaeritorhiza haematococci]|nr:Polynucleotide 5'-hydroxyl-kinase grc3 [Quaeritorhiza haematococci]
MGYTFNASRRLESVLQRTEGMFTSKSDLMDVSPEIATTADVADSKSKGRKKSKQQKAQLLNTESSRLPSTVSSGGACIEGLNFYPCFSPKSTSLLVIEAVKSSQNARGREESMTSEVDSRQPQHATDFRSLVNLYGRLEEGESKFDTIVALKNLSSSEIQGVERFLPSFKGLFRVLSVGEQGGLHQELSSSKLPIKGFHPMLEPSSPAPSLFIPPSWRDFVDRHILQKLSPTIRNDSDLLPPQNGNLPPVYCFVGSRNTGKSTFSRFVTNSLLNRYRKVAFLECDMGQCEFTPPGMVSLHIVSNPILGPPFTHLLLGISDFSPNQNSSYTVRSHYLGATSPRQDPNTYLRSIRDLYDTYRQIVNENGSVDEPIPLVINTPGWIKGMGFDLLSHFLDYVRPTIVACLEAGTPSFDAEGNQSLSAELKSILGQMAMTNEFEEDADGEERSRESWAHAAIVRVDGLEEKMMRLKFNAADHRNLATISYFSQLKPDPTFPIFIRFTKDLAPNPELATATTSVTTMKPWWAFDEPITAWLPYCVPWKAVQVNFMHCETLYALNGSLVALIANSSTMQQPAPEGSTCIGLGIVRSIDRTSPSTSNEGSPESRDDEVVFHVVAPLPLDQVSQVNCFARGAGVEIPMPLLVSGYETTSAPLPYTTHLLAEGIGSIARRVRNNLQRRKQQKEAPDSNE